MTASIEQLLFDVDERLCYARNLISAVPYDSPRFDDLTNHIADLELIGARLRELPERDDAEDFKVLRRFAPRDYYTHKPTLADGVDMSEAEPPLKTGLYVDVEATGLDTARDHIIELALVPFEFDATGRIYDIGAGLSWLNDPGIPIPPEITKLTGITDEMVKGQSIDDATVFLALSGASLVVAHNADYDRRMIERRLPAFANISWGCSYREVDWGSFGCACSRLEHVLMSACGEFYSAHRALDDCFVGVHVLAAAQLDGRSAFSYLLDQVRQPTARVYAMGAPFDAKDMLKARKYRWSDGSGGRRKAWYIDVKPDALEAESQWLRTISVYSPQVDKLTARERFSVRSDR